MGNQIQISISRDKDKPKTQIKIKSELNKRRRKKKILQGGLVIRFNFFLAKRLLQAFHHVFSNGIRVLIVLVAIWTS